MPKKLRFEGLCINCKRNTTCKLPKALSEPIVECEEFEIGGGRGGKSAKAASGKPKAQEDRGGGAAPARAGLCVDCEDLKTCKLPNAGKPIWYCEEYR